MMMTMMVRNILTYLLTYLLFLRNRRTAEINNATRPPMEGGRVISRLNAIVRQYCNSIGQRHCLLAIMQTFAVTMKLHGRCACQISRRDTLRIRLSATHTIDRSFDDWLTDNIYYSALNGWMLAPRLLLPRGNESRIHLLRSESKTKGRFRIGAGSGSRRGNFAISIAV